MNNTTHINRIVISGVKSGSGKTTLTCGLIRAFLNRGLKTASRKCGPDYIDPMFHRRVLGIETGNLDPFFTDDETLKYLMTKDCEDCDIEIIEGVMGFYDGLGGITTGASTYDVARITDSPVILVVDAKGVSVTLSAVIQGIINYRKDNNIKGVILNRMSAGFYERIAGLIEKECNIRVLGFLPELKEAELRSRHLGLVQPDELEDLDEVLNRLASQIEETIDVDGIYKIAEGANDIIYNATIHGRKEALAAPKESDCSRTDDNCLTECRDGVCSPGMPAALEKLLTSDRVQSIRRAAPIIAIAKDRAFGFYYDDNIRLLKELGARIEYFSPLKDKKLPAGTQGIILYGGYPEEHCHELSSNTSMLEAIREAYRMGIPIIAECGGFMYLMDTLEDREGNGYRMCGVIPGRAYCTGHTVRFGYMHAEALNGGLYGDKGIDFNGHEFHHWDCTINGEDFIAHKPLSDRTYKCMIHEETLAAGFPHIYAYGNPEMYVNFLLNTITAS
ncbi:MAG: cobyrinate a,c-diamide synthase [Lachnospiraceae bacterium]|nr:cobyrinate a,c-diamide synthase [Lachnospiraceae bacterium]